MKAVVAAFNQEKALVGVFSVITNLRMELFEALVVTLSSLTPVYPPRALLPLADSCSLPGQDPGVHIPRLKPPHGRVSQGLGGGRSEMNRTSAVERSIGSQSVFTITKKVPTRAFS